MANPYYVQSLSGLNPGAELQEVLDRRELSKQKEQQSMEQEKARDLLRKAYSGDADSIKEIFAMDPDIGLKLKTIEDERRANLGQQRKQVADNANFEYSKSIRMARTPEEKQEIINRAIEDPTSDLYDEEDIGKSIEEMEADANINLYTRVGEDGYRTLFGAEETQTKDTSLIKNLEAAGLKRGSTEFKQAVLNNIAGKNESITVNPDGTVTIAKGGAVNTLPKKTTADLNNAVIGDIKIKSELNNIKELYSPDMLTYGGKVKALALSKKSKVGLSLDNEDKKFLSDRLKMTQSVNRLFNQYRKEITGAAAAVQELAGLKRSILNEDLSPAEFESSLSDFERLVNSSLEIKQQMLKEGLNPNEKNFGIELDRRIAEGETVSRKERTDEDILAEYGL